MKKSGTAQHLEVFCHCEERQRRSNHGFEIASSFDLAQDEVPSFCRGASLPSVARNDDEALPKAELLQKSGITLVEMIVAMLLSTVIICAIGIQFVAMVRFNTTLQNTINAERDAYIIANNMARILRFADPATFDFGTPNQFSVIIKAGHLSFVTTDTRVRYARGWPTATSLLVTSLVAGGPYVILSRNVSFWDVAGTIYDSATRELSIVFDITKTSANGQTVTIPIRTKIKVIGDL